ncbi:1-(5-phosphoribosyl)-5-[(5-phosphoribosylamino)methylideneamino] imidazole-4-carboxamide isomerase [Diplonema papillatum]|nr:1-(5-phosphoribosyl)-5-[(5-phosphoribosylamino)methylideneamino] imidazole-4-carboxamide isomerase [Diplonema papillatum]
MTCFRLCIDLHSGQVKQIVGATLTDDASQGPKENFVSEKPAAHYAELYKKDGLTVGPATPPPTWRPFG